MDEARVIYDITALWVTLSITVATTLGVLITQIVNARKTMVETKSLQQKQNTLAEGQEQILGQFKNNGGSTLKDANDDLKAVTARIEKILEENSKAISDMQELQHETRSDIQGIRRDAGRLADVDMEDRQRAVREHAEIVRLIDENRKDLSSHIAEVPGVINQIKEDILKAIEEKKECN